MAQAPHAHLSLMTLGVTDVARSARFYEALGFTRKMRNAPGEVAFFEAGPVALSLYRIDKLAEDMQVEPTQLPAFRGSTLAWNCNDPADVDAVMALAAKAGGTIVRSPFRIFWAAMSGSSPIPTAMSGRSRIIRASRFRPTAA